MTRVSVQSERGIVVTIQPQAPRPILVKRPGVQGRGATVQIGTVTTVQPPNPATVTNSGDPTDAIFDFEIPQGEAATVAVGSVTTVSPASPAKVTNSGTTGAAVLDFEIPQGIPGVVQNIVPGAGVSIDNSDPINPEIALDGASIASLALADTAVQPSRSISAGTGLTGGGTLEANRAIALNSASLASLGLADTAVQPGDLAAVATTGAYSDLSGLPSLGTASAQNVEAFVPSSKIADIDANTAARHTHSNKAILDGTTASFLAAEKTKLAGIQAGAQVNPGVATTSASGLMSSSDKAKLNGVEAGAQVNLPIGTTAGTVAAGDDSRLVNAYSRGNILGTVSQSGGVPTGAIIESGSNANGEYVRYADGTQMCWKVNHGGSSETQTWTFPVSFPTQPAIIATVQRPQLQLRGISMASAGSGTSTQYNIFNSSNNIVGDPVNILAIGRWF